MPITLVKSFQASPSYATDHEANANAIETAINDLESRITGQGGNSTFDLRANELFDRNGIFGQASYKPTAGTLSAPDYDLTVAAGSYYSGSEYRTKATSTLISMSAESTGTKYVNVPTGGSPTVSTSAGADTVWSFSYDTGTKVVSAVTFYSSTADILIDGDDYNAMLGSYLSVADRLTAIEAATGVLGQYYSEDAGSHSGLNFGYFGGLVHNDNTVTSTADGTVALTDASTNYVEVHPGTGVVSANTTSFTSGRIPLFTVTTSGGTIGTVTDKRSWARAGTGGGGGHTQNTDLGTDSTDFKLNRLHTGAPSSNCTLTVERGTSSDVSIRWNESTDEWEFTNDGTTFESIGTGGGGGGFDPGAQVLSKYKALDNPVQIIERTSLSTDGAYVQTDLGPTGTNTISDAPQGCAGLVLRVQFWDSAPGAGVNVKFRGYGSISSPTKSYTVWGGTNEEDDVGTLVIPGDNGASTPTIGLEHLVTASGTGTANVRVFLLGYFIKVTGVGTQTKTFQSTGNAVTASTSTNFNKTSFLNRGLVYLLKITETGTLVTGTYDVQIYAKDTFLAADLLYQASAIDPTASSRIYTDRLPWMYLDSDSTSELHIKITNNDGSNTATFTIDISAEQFL